MSTPPASAEPDEIPHEICPKCGGPLMGDRHRYCDLNRLPAAPSPSAEPVAWRQQTVIEEDGTWMWRYRTQPPTDAAAPQWEPLYAAPPAPPASPGAGEDTPLADGSVDALIARLGMRTVTRPYKLSPLMSVTVADPDCAEAAAALTALRSELAASKEDAARYRWLRDRGWYPRHYIASVSPNQDSPAYEIAKYAAVDVAIDAARQEPRE